VNKANIYNDCKGDFLRTKLTIKLYLIVQEQTSSTGAKRSLAIWQEH